MNGWDKFLQKNGALIMKELINHIELVAISVCIAAFISIPLGIYLSRTNKLARYVLAFSGMVQTIPGLVMLGFAMIFLGIGRTSAIFVLVIYAILPILSNTYTGINNVENMYKEAAKGIGMTTVQTLLKVELPLALPSIIAGIRISTVYIVSWATLAGLIGAGGLGDLIWTGLSTYENKYIISGAVPSALLAIVLGGLIGFVQKMLTPKALRQGG